MTITQSSPAGQVSPPPGGDLRVLPVTAMMSPYFECVGSGMSVMRALDIYLGTGLRHLAVVDTMGRCLGAVTVEAAALRLAGHGAPPSATMDDMLPASVTTATTRTTVADAAAIMLDGLVNVLCVLDSELCPVGVVTWSDIVGLVAGSSGRRRTQES